jgi:hypothetical protein
MDANDWEARLAGLWAAIDEYDEGDFVTTMTTLVGERPAGAPVGLFELAGSYDSTGRTDLAVAVAGFLALALADVGREREALSMALTALAPHLPRYSRSLTNYARLLTDQD